MTVNKSEYSYETNLSDQHYLDRLVGMINDAPEQYRRYKLAASYVNTYCDRPPLGKPSISTAVLSYNPIIMSINLCLSQIQQPPAIEIIDSRIKLHDTASLVSLNSFDVESGEWDCTFETNKTVAVISIVHDELVHDLAKQLPADSNFRLGYTPSQLGDI